MADGKIGNPTAVGLVTFGITVILFSMFPLGLTNMNGLLFGQLVFSGGVAFIIVGIFKFLIDDTYGATVFLPFGFMLLAFATMVIGAVGAPNNPQFVGWFFILWGIFSLMATIGGNIGKKPAMLQLALLLFTIELILVGFKYLSGSNLMTIAGIIGVLAGIAAFYTAWGVFLNGLAGKKVLPI